MSNELPSGMSTDSKASGSNVHPPSGQSLSRSARKFPWTKEEDALLGKVPDREVAEKFNRTLAGVRDRRRFLGKAAVGRAPANLRYESEPRDGYAELFAAK